jgi:PH/SEC7 domain-containing protein
MEYGWQRISDPLPDDLEDKGSIRSARSNYSKFSTTYGRKSLQPLDRVYINDWKPPQPAAMPSPLDEEQQLDALQIYLKHVAEEVEQHKSLEEPMMRQVGCRPELS